jgi:hypothetical protein
MAVYVSTAERADLEADLLVLNVVLGNWLSPRRRADSHWQESLTLARDSSYRPRQQDKLPGPLNVWRIGVLMKRKYTFERRIDSRAVSTNGHPHGGIFYVFRSDRGFPYTIMIQHFWKGTDTLSRS